MSEQAEVPEKGGLPEDALNEANPVSSADSIRKNALPGSSIQTPFRSFLQAVSRDLKSADTVTVSLNLNEVKESLSNREPARDKPSAAIQKQDLQPERAYQTLVARAYEYLRNSLDAVKEEMAGDHQLTMVYLGSAIVSSVGLSVGYVVWLLRGGMLLGSLLSSAGRPRRWRLPRPRTRGMAAPLSIRSRAPRGPHETLALFVSLHSTRAPGRPKPVLHFESDEVHVRPRSGRVHRVRLDPEVIGDQRPAAPSQGTISRSVLSRTR